MRLSFALNANVTLIWYKSPTQRIFSVEHNCCYSNIYVITVIGDLLKVRCPDKQLRRYVSRQALSFTGYYHHESIRAKVF